MASSFTSNKVLEKPANGDYVDTWNVPLNGDMDIIDQAFGGVTNLNATSGSAILTDTQYRSLSLSVTGAMSANVIYTIPSGVGGQWIVRNATTDASGGPWTVTIASGGGGTSVTVVRNAPTHIYSDGTNIRLASFVSAGSIGADAVTTSTIQDGAVTYPKINSAALATGAEFRNDSASKVLPVSSVWDAAEYVTTAYASTVTLDFNAGFNFAITLTGNITLANPTNPKPGQSGIIALTQDGTGGRTTTFGTNFKFPNGVTPTFDTAANRVNIVSYTVISSTFIVVSVLPGVR